jgi:hypothetical protein
VKKQMGEESYSIDELGAKLALENKIIDWMKTKEFDPEGPILVFNYLPSFSTVGSQNFVTNKQDIANRLVSFIFDE